MSNGLINVSIRDGDKYYRASVTTDWYKRHNNYAMVSIGLKVGEDLTRGSFNRLQAAGRLREITREQWSHSGCQSACKLRGDATCRW